MADEYKVIELEEKTFLGYTLRTTNADEQGPNAKIAPAWAHFFGNNIPALIGEYTGEKAACSTCYGVYSDYEKDATGAYDVTLGFEANEVEGKPLPDGITKKVAPKQHYLVFPSAVGPMPAVIIQVWETVWKYFERTDIPYKRTYQADLESYEGVTDNMNAQVFIYIGIEPPESH